MPMKIKRIQDLTTQAKQYNMPWFHWTFNYEKVDFACSYLIEESALYICQRMVTANPWNHTFKVKKINDDLIVAHHYLKPDKFIPLRNIVAAANNVSFFGVTPTELISQADAQARINKKIRNGTNPDVLPYSILKTLEEPEKRFFYTWRFNTPPRNVTHQNYLKTLYFTQDKQLAEWCKKNGCSSVWTDDPTKANIITPPKGLVNLNPRH
ncbi:MAG: DUF6037 family protein [Varibaculum cambriense]|nr:DUF6037 family protein [Varibaculum cambriense]